MYTCEQTLAGIAGGQGLDAVGRVRDFISSVLDSDGVRACGVRHVRHSVGAISVVLDGGLLGLALWVLERERSTCGHESAIWVDNSDG